APPNTRPHGPRPGSAEANSHRTAYRSARAPDGFPRGSAAAHRVALAGYRGHPRCSPRRPSPGQSNRGPSGRRRWDIRSRACGRAQFSLSYPLWGREVRVELLADRHHLLAGEAVAGGKIGDRFEVVVLSTRQAPVEQARRRVADVLETVHDVARDKHDGTGTGRRGLAIDGQLIGSVQDADPFFLVEMDVVGRAFVGFVPSHENRDGAASSLGREE